MKFTDLTMAAIPFASALCCATLAAVLWRSRKNATGVSLLALLVTSGVWAFFYGLELAAPTYRLKLLFDQLEYLGIPFVAPCWCVVAIRAVGFSHLLNRRRIALLFVIPAIVLLAAFTNPFFHLLWKQVLLSPDGMPFLQYHYGPFFWLDIAYAWLLLLCGAIFLIREALTSPSLLLQQRLLLIVSVAAPWAGNIAYVMKSGPIPGLDLTPSAFILSVIALFYGQLRYKLSALVPIARGYILEHTQEALFVLDRDAVLIDINAAGRRLLARDAADVLGQPACDAFAGVPALQQLARAEDAATSRFETAPANEKLTFDAVICALRSKRGAVLARAISCRDITAQLAAENALRKSEDRYRDLVENSQGLICSHDLEGKLLFVNAAAAQALGYTPDQMIGKSLADFVVPENRPLVPRYLDRVRTHKSATDTLTVHTNDGRQLVWEYRNHCYQDENGTPYVIGHALDVTERVRAEEALRASELYLRSIIENEPECVKLVSPEGFLMDMNPAGLAMLEAQSKDQITGLPVQKVIAPEDWPQYHALHQRVMQGETGALEFDVIGLGGTRRRVDTHIAPLRDTEGNVCAQIAITRDITERGRAEDALRESEARFREFLEADPSACLLFDSQLNYVYFNKAAQELTGVTLEQAKGRNMTEFVPGLQGSERYAKYENVLRTQRPFFIPAHAPGGLFGDKVFNVRAFPVGPNLGIIWTDITELKRAEEGQRKLEAQILHTQKLESLGVLAGGIAHDFNNILMAIMGHVSLALDELSPLSPVCNDLTEIENASHRAAELCRQMLAYSGRGKFTVEAMALCDLIEEMAHLLKTSISKKVTLNLIHDKPQPPIHGDATQIRQIILNLIVNASEAIGNCEGVITVSSGSTTCNRDDLNHALVGNDLPPGPYVYLQVTDTGCGMDQDTLRRIFEPFFTTKFTGRGLGLSAVMGIVRGHHGALTLDSTPGQGTTFRILFPAPESSPAPLSKSNAVTEQDWKGHGQILLVDDEQTIRDVGKEMLERLGFSVVTAADGQEALQVYQSSDPPVDWVLLDLTMPRMSGEETWKELRRLNPHVRVILSSGYTAQDAAERFANQGIAGFLQKPYTFTTLRDQVRNLTSRD